MKVIYWAFRLIALVTLCASSLNAMEAQWKIAYWFMTAYSIAALIARVFKRGADLDEVQLGKRQRTDFKHDYGPAGEDDGTVEEKAP
jgi:hypothetical protein